MKRLAMKKKFFFQRILYLTYEDYVFELHYWAVHCILAKLRVRIAFGWHKKGKDILN